jgi:type II secretory pathway component PulF
MQLLIIMLGAALAALVLVLGYSLARDYYFSLSLPMRRRDRARFFLDLLETVIQRGQPVEPAILSAAENEDRSIGVEFYRVAAQIEDGARLGEALARVPTFLPPQVNEMIRAGEKLGELNKVLPACREVLRVPPDSVRTMTHYMAGLLLIVTPVIMGLIFLLTVFVVPKYKELAGGMGVPAWPVAQFVFRHLPGMLWVDATLFCALAGFVNLYNGGSSGLIRWLRFRRVPVVDWIAWRLPWNQKKLLRGFSAMLAVLLDGGMPEAEAVRLAGESTVNEICRRRAERVVAALAQGARLDEAIRAFDGTGEFRWRLANAAHGQGGFLDALRGWHAALEARAFQQEETAAHAFTSGLVIFNGVMVGLVAVGMFGLLVMLLKATIAAT